MSAVTDVTQPAYICWNLTIEALEQGVKYGHQGVKYGHQSGAIGVFIVNFKYISHLVLVFLLITLNM